MTRASIAAGLIKEFLMYTLAALFPDGWAHFLIGGVLIGAGVSLVYVGTGLVGGTSSFFSASWSWFSRLGFFDLPRWHEERRWRVLYAAGLIGGALLWTLTLGTPQSTAVPALQLLIGGLFAGFGARLSGGCTAGHGICGLASLKRESFVAVPVFLLTAIITAHLARLWGLA